ncbi:hypothetical protein MVEN_02458600 [Mycena venus]|uniref:Uncharacterized protein n=1 Tax=Mycena venus TaxID=2733690 RepID=A0A8H6WX41_9AGAR|nr:hypothetical protein MVEN_02458600 [Mycena venus]
MGWESEEFRKFERYLRETAVMMGLDTFAGPDKQDTSKWAKFVENCLREFPALGTDFEDEWPIEVYYSKYTAKRLEYYNYDGIKKIHWQSPIVTEIIGSAQPRSQRQRVRETRLRVVHRGQKSRFHLAGSQVASSTITPSPSTVILASPPTRTLQYAKIISCVLCGSRPLVSSRQKVTLNKFFDGREDLRRGFDAAGIIADNHFRVLLRLSAHQRESLECSYTSIKERMEIADEEYFQFVHIVEEYIPRYLNIVPFDKQNQDQVQALIRKARPSVKRYENLWPLEVLIKRYLGARLTGLPGTLHEPDLKIPHECPLQRFYPAHDVPSALASILLDYEMEELGPAFLSLGIRSDEAFTTITRSHKLATGLLGDINLKQLQLTDFQTMMMGLILGGDLGEQCKFGAFYVYVI